ncbi:hypothetical protein AGDE_00458 [Angomonas deanei]|nr:hypothetical protein AGDE_00458 [Angomonas deanei]|eukprot:EPY43463.1 hypothetical protein AGDE_00458 [Angomonas deanei]
MESVSINGFVYRIPFPIYIYLLYSTLHTSQTKMEKAQALFDKCAPLLEEAAFSTWKRSEVEMFFQVLAEYHQASAMAEEEEEAEDVAESHYKTTVAEVDRFLVKVKGFLNEKYPFGSIEEPTRVPNSGEVSATAAPVVSVDAFLYDEEDVQQLIEKGQLSDRYCLECGSMKTGLTEFITHSFSRDQLVFIVCYVLPYLRNELQCDVSKLVEVGARFGNLLWACFAAAEERQTVVKEVVGVELDQKMVDVQRALLTRFCSRPKPTKPPHLPHRPQRLFRGRGEGCLDRWGCAGLTQRISVLCANPRRPRPVLDHPTGNREPTWSDPSLLPAHRGNLEWGGRGRDSAAPQDQEAAEGGDPNWRGDPTVAGGVRGVHHDR